MENLIQKNIEGLKKLTLQIEALNDQLEGLLYDVRYNAKLCVDCGRPVEEAHDEYCKSCYEEAFKTWADKDVFTLRATTRGVL